ncbi:MAG: hypothetical protein LKJ25_04610 [Clostridia bacterium]|nr:hypothetical protein [Clostridia bacterium]
MSLKVTEKMEETVYKYIKKMYQKNNTPLTHHSVSRDLRITEEEALSCMQNLLEKNKLGFKAYPLDNVIDPHCSSFYYPK